MAFVATAGDRDKLVSLRGSGDLSQAECEKAKERLLSGQPMGFVSSHDLVITRQTDT